MDKVEIINIALESGFMLNSQYGQGSDKLMPVSDSSTLINFAKAILQADKGT